MNTTFRNSYLKGNRKNNKVTQLPYDGNIFALDLLNFITYKFISRQDAKINSDFKGTCE